MKDLKFRCWEPLNKEMHYLDFALYQFSNGFNSHKFVLPPEKQSLQNPYTIMNLDAVNVMQFTGLKDRHNKEVYESDIIKENDGGDIWYWEVKYSEEDAAYYLKHHGTGETFYFDDLIDVIKNGVVVGNVYDKPDLLK